jgi:hypothetical protein
MENEAVTPEAPVATAPTSEPAPTPTPVQPEQPELSVEQLKAKLEDTVKHSRKHEQRAEANFEKAKLWDEYESKLKPEQDKTAQKLSETLKELEDLKLNILKNEVALEMNLPKEALSRLQGTTAEELKADAASLLALFGGIVEVPTVQRPGVRPVPTAGNFADKAKPLSVSTPEEYLAALRSGS